MVIQNIATPVPHLNTVVLAQHKDIRAHKHLQYTTQRDDELALLDNAFVKQSPQLMREYVPIAVSTQINPTDALLAQQHTIDIPCVRVEIPQRDWSRIVQLIEAHERAIKHPAVQDAWEQYLMMTHLTKPYEDLKNR